MNQNQGEISKIMENQDRRLSENQQLARLIELSEKQLFHARVKSVLTLITTLCVVYALILVVPAIRKTAASADAVIAQASITITLMDEGIGGIIEMSEAITEMGQSMDALIEENGDAVSSLMKEVEAIDFEGLNKAIKDLGDVVEPFAKFFNRFK